MGEEEEDHLRSVSEYPNPEALRRALQDCKQDDDEEGKVDDGNELDESLDWVLTNYDTGTTRPQTIQEELERLQTLQSYLRLDETADEELDRLTAMASRIFDLPIALISLIDLGKQWFLSNHGLGDAKHGPRKIAVCAHAIQGTLDVLVVPDATKDARFANLPQVLGPPHVTFYAGTPLLSPEGYKIGSFCLVDDKPRYDFTKEDGQTLMDLAATAMDSLVRHRRQKEMVSPEFIACTAHDWLTPLMGLQLSLSLVQEEEERLLSVQQQEILHKAIVSTRYMQQVSQSTLDYLKKNLILTKPTNVLPSGEDNLDLVDLGEWVETLKQLVPSPQYVTFQLGETLPTHILSNELKLLRAALNLLIHASRTGGNGHVHVHFHIYKRTASQEYLIFECHNTNMTTYGTPQAAGRDNLQPDSLGLESIARQMKSLGGTCFGINNQERLGESKEEDMHINTGTAVGFQIPLILPNEMSRNLHMKQTRNTMATSAQQCRNQ